MSHDPSNKVCPCTAEHGASGTGCSRCTCPPAVDEVEQIRAMVALAKANKFTGLGYRNQMTLTANFESLLRIVDQLQGRVAHNYKMAQEYKAKLAAAKRELPDYIDSRVVQADKRLTDALGELDKVKTLYIRLWRKTKPIADPCSGECHFGGRCPHRPVCND